MQHRPKRKLTHFFFINIAEIQPNATERKTRTQHMMINAETSRCNMNVFVIRFFATFSHTNWRNNNAADTYTYVHVCKFSLCEKNYEFHFAKCGGRETGRITLNSKI